MRALMLPDLALAIYHLLDDKAEVLGCTLCGQFYRPRLVAQLAAIERLPLVGPTGRPLAEAIAEAEVISDTIDLLCDLRGAICDELVTDPMIHDQVDTDLFSFIDLLAADREATVRRRAMAVTSALPASMAGETAPTVE